jgi:hypothetical protein
VDGLVDPEEDHAVHVEHLEAVVDEGFPARRRTDAVKVDLGSEPVLGESA